MRDSGSPRASTGAYPVRLDGDYTTVLSITNVTDKKGEFTLQVNYDVGTYELGLVTANPGETKNFDIRKLRDAQTPDRNGHPFPRDLSTGQIRWSMRGNGSVPLFGRAEVVSQRDRVSSSYSCVTCCPHSFNDGWLDPGSSSIFSGDSQQILGEERERDCYGNIYGPYEMGSGSWYAANPDIGSVDSNGLATGVSPGTAGVSFTWPIYYWMQDFDEQCLANESSTSADALLDILTAPKTFYPVSVTQTDLNCPLGYFGYGAEVRYGVADILGLPLTKSGMTPRELVYINGFVQYPFVFQSFADPPQTNSQGLFTDRPIGTCFQVDPFSSLNPCVDVVQHFDIVVPNDANSPRTIITVTRRHDCRRGIKVEVENGPVVNTYTLGEVP